MKSYYVTFKYQDGNKELDSEEIDFEDNEEVSQRTVYDKVQALHDDWYTYREVGKIIAWSRIEEKK